MPSRPLATLARGRRGNGRLTGALPASFANLSSLTTLQLQGCGLTGTLPPAWGDGLQSLMLLNLSGNALRGPLPPSWGPLLGGALLSLDASGNKLQGTIPESWAARAGQRVWAQFAPALHHNPGLSGCVPAGYLASASVSPPEASWPPMAAGGAAGAAAAPARDKLYARLEEGTQLKRC